MGTVGVARNANKYLGLRADFIYANLPLRDSTLQLAQATGAPIGAFHLQPERAWTLKSWDRFLIPKPFTRIVVSWAQWTRVPADLPAEQFEVMRRGLNDAIERARMRALTHLGQSEP